MGGTEGRLLALTVLAVLSFAPQGSFYAWALLAVRRAAAGARTVRGVLVQQQGRAGAVPPAGGEPAGPDWRSAIRRGRLSYPWRPGQAPPLRLPAGRRLPGRATAVGQPAPRTAGESAGPSAASPSATRRNG